MRKTKTSKIKTSKIKLDQTSLESGLVMPRKYKYVPYEQRKVSDYTLAFVYLAFRDAKVPMSAFQVQKAFKISAFEISLPTIYSAIQELRKMNCIKEVEQITKVPGKKASIYYRATFHNCDFCREYFR